MTILEVLTYVGNMPAAVIPLSISAYFTICIFIDMIKIRALNQKIEVELSSDVELIFDLNGNFLRLDD